MENSGILQTFFQKLGLAGARTTGATKCCKLVSFVNQTIMAFAGSILGTLQFASSANLVFILGSIQEP